MKKAGIVLFVVGIALILVSLLWPIAMFIMHIDELESAAIGIIGGADGPTFWFLYSSAIRYTFLRFVLDAGVIAVVISLFFLLRKK